MQQMLLILARLMRRTLKALRYPTLWWRVALELLCLAFHVCVAFLCFRALDVQGILSGWENQSIMLVPLEVDLEPELEPEPELESELELEPD